MTKTEADEQVRQQVQERARMRGRSDERLGVRTHAPLYPPGALGHADYELGHQDIELARDKQARLRFVRRARAPRRPSKKERAAGLALGHPKP